jgi:chemotaxis protein histidine kinase CheA
MALINLSIAQYVIDLAEKLEDIHGVQMCDTIEQWNKITGMKICEDADLSKLGDDYKGGRINKFVVELGPHNKIKYVAQPAKAATKEKKPKAKKAAAKEKPAAKSAEKKKAAPAKTAKKSAKTQVKENVKLLNSLVREAQEIIGSNRIRGSASTFDEMEVVMNKLDAIQEVVTPDDKTEKIINGIYEIYWIISDRMRNDDGEFSDPINYYDYDEMMDEMMSLIGYD